MAKVVVTFYKGLKSDLNGHQMAVPDGPPLAAPIWLDTAGTKVTGVASMPNTATVARIATDGKIVRNITLAGTAATDGVHEPQYANTFEYVGVQPDARIAIETAA